MDGHMAAGFDIVTMDTPDTVALSEFWCAALGLVELEREVARAERIGQKS